MSFIKRGSEIEVVDSTTLPFGIVDDMDVTPIRKKVIDIDKDNVGEYTWIVNYLKGEQVNPEILAREILEQAKRKSNGRVLDDMTVIVSKLYSTY